MTFVKVEINEYETPISGGGYLRLTHYLNDDTVTLLITNPEYEPVASIELAIRAELSDVAEILKQIITKETTPTTPTESEGTN
jgi:hypothetical protein